MGGRMPTMICWYWTMKAKARFLAGDHAEALAAVDKATALLWSSTGHFPLIDYYYYAALTVAALDENTSAVERPRWGELLEAMRPAARVGGSQSAELRRQARPRSRPRSPASKAGSWTRCVSTTRPLRWRANMVSCRTRAWPMSWPRSSTQRVASRPLPTPICGTPEDVICAGAPTAR